MHVSCFGQVNEPKTTIPDVFGIGAGYKVLKNATAQIGYRRLYLNRQDGSNFGLEATQQGLILGTTIRFR
jgi:hypothetical protein